MRFLTWCRYTWLLPVLLVATVVSASPLASAQPACDSAQPLATGAWSGRFEVRWQVRWTADLANQPTNVDLAPATWENTRTIRGDLDLLVGQDGSDGTPSTDGVARASWESETTAERPDGARMVNHQSGLLSGGSLALPVSGFLAPGDAIAWLGGWWTRPAGTPEAMFSSTFTFRAADGRTPAQVADAIIALL